jgi:ankyrin repeat protein
MRLPNELWEKVICFLELEKILEISKYCARAVYNPQIHTFKETILARKLTVLEFLYEMHLLSSENTVLNSKDVETHESTANTTTISTNTPQRINPDGPNLLELSCEVGDIDILRFVTKNFDYSSNESIDIASAHGYFDVVVYLHENGGNATAAALDMACFHGNFEIVQFLHENRSEGCTTLAMDYASERGNLDIVQFLHTHRSEGCTEKAMNMAAKNGHYKVVVFLDTNRTENCKTSALEYAAQSGNVEIFEYLIQKSGEERESPSFALGWAAINGHLGVVQLLNQIDYSKEFTDGIIDLAAMNGHLEVVQYLYSNYNLRCSENSLRWAVKYGHCHMVIWLLENQVPCSDDLVDIGKEYKRQDILKLLANYDRFNTKIKQDCF